jgi:hypothetical protein
MTTRTMIRVLQGVSIAGALLAVWALVAPARAGTAVLPVVLPPVGSADAEPVVMDTVLRESIVDANIFSLSRRRPARRTVPTTTTSLADTLASLGVSLSDTSTTMPDGSDSGVVASAPDRVPRLYGIVEGADGARALLRLDRTMPGAMLYREGEGASVYRVRRIESDRVVLAGPRGSLVLRLTPRRTVP